MNYHTKKLIKLCHSFLWTSWILSPIGCYSFIYFYTFTGHTRFEHFKKFFHISSLGESVPNVASDSHSCPTGVKYLVVFCYCSLSCCASWDVDLLTTAVKSACASFPISSNQSGHSCITSFNNNVYPTPEHTACFLYITPFSPVIPGVEQFLKYS